MNDVMPNVFVTKFQPDWDFASAVEYGHVIFLTEKEIQYEPTIPVNTDRIVNEIRNKLVGYMPGIDFILLTASAINNIVASHEVLGHPGQHQFLRWNSNRNNDKPPGYRLYRLRTK